MMERCRMSEHQSSTFMLKDILLDSRVICQKTPAAYLCSSSNSSSSSTLKWQLMERSGQQAPTRKLLPTHWLKRPRLWLHGARRAVSGVVGQDDVVRKP